jgi:hypothetical protein
VIQIQISNNSHTYPPSKQHHTDGDEITPEIGQPLNKNQLLHSSEKSKNIPNMEAVKKILPTYYKLQQEKYQLVSDNEVQKS